MYSDAPVAPTRRQRLWRLGKPLLVLAAAALLLDRYVGVAHEARVWAMNRTRWAASRVAERAMMEVRITAPVDVSGSYRLVEVNGGALPFRYLRDDTRSWFVDSGSMAVHRDSAENQISFRVASMGQRDMDVRSRAPLGLQRTLGHLRFSDGSTAEALGDTIQRTLFLPNERVTLRLTYVR